MSATRVTLVLLLALSGISAHAGHDHDDHDHHHDDDHDHDDHDHEHHDEHDHDHHHHDDHDHDHNHHDELHSHHHTIEVSASTWDGIIGGDEHVWAVKFHSAMCSSCQAFAPEWEAAREALDGLHWAAVNIDHKENIALAKRFGVLQEGIPNVKLINAAEMPLPVITGDVVKADAVVAAIRDALSSVDAKLVDGYYVSHSKGEL